MKPPTPLLGESPEVFRQAFRDSNDAMVITDTDGKIVTANRAWLDLYGFTLEEVAGQSTRVIKSENSTGEMYVHMWEQIRNPSLGYWKGEVVNRKKNGEEVPVLLTVTPIRRSGEIIGYMGIGIDITERKEFERFKELYDTVMRHDLRSPLNSIMSMTDMLLSGYAGPLTDKQRDVVQRTMAQCKRMETMIATSLAVEKLKRNCINLDLREIDLFDTVRSTFETLRPKAESRKVKLVLLGSGGAACGGETLVRKLDPIHLERCTDNLVLNAIEASPVGGTVTVRVFNADGAATLSVHNNGKPIPPELRAVLFHPFCTYGKRGGSGLGAYGVKLTIEAMGGTIDYTTGEHGTTFFARFPAEAAIANPSGNDPAV